MLILNPRIIRAASFATLITTPSITPSTQRSMSSSSSHWPIEPYTPRHSSWPYTPRDFTRADETPDTNFYGPPRFVTHIDDNAISTLRQYYGEVLPKRGKVLDLCTSWISHFPPVLEDLARRAKKGDKEGLEVIGMGMNKKEISANPILSSSFLIDLNSNPTLPTEITQLDSTVCVVSIDYLTQPLPVLTSIFEKTNPGGSVHLVLSNRCFPTKAIGRWLKIDEEERVKMVGDYLWFSGWRNIEAVTLVPKSNRWMGGNDPLWVVRGKKVDQGE